MLSLSVKNLTAVRDSLIVELNHLENNLSLLKMLNAYLKKSYDNLVLSRTLSETLKGSHLLWDYYDMVRSFYRDGKLNITMTRFMADLAKHNLGRTYCPLEDPYFQITGEHSWTTVMRKLEAVYTLIGIKPEDAPIERIKKILQFINDNVRYQVDYDNVFLSPLETLIFGSGDCDDYTILAATLFEMAEIDAAVAIGTFAYANKTIGHTMVLVHMDTLGPYGFHSYEDLTDMGLSLGKWILIESQNTIDKQYDPDWFSHWMLETAVDV
ncbi:MAG: transglutaminase domain-containing protein [Candidatus Brockarchaeota archaeon]|nr:transglutaminase domain-containing protein [Candidatus Brockarchaeota archaeon]